jgi:type IV secretory pathway TrbF-like protein
MDHKEFLEMQKRIDEKYKDYDEYLNKLNDYIKEVDNFNKKINDKEFIDNLVKNKIKESNIKFDKDLVEKEKDDIAKGLNDFFDEFLNKDNKNE